MTDLEKTLFLLKELDIGYGTSTDKDRNEIMITFEKGNHKVHGYSGFVCTWTFDENGKFKDMGIYE